MKVGWIYYFTSHPNGTMVKEDSCSMASSSSKYPTCLAETVACHSELMKSAPWSSESEIQFSVVNNYYIFLSPLFSQDSSHGFSSFILTAFL